MRQGLGRWYRFLGGAQSEAKTIDGTPSPTDTDSRMLTFLRPPQITNSSSFYARQKSLVILAIGDVLACGLIAWMPVVPYSRPVFLAMIVLNLVYLVTFLMQPILLKITEEGVWIRSLFRPYKFIPFSNIGAVELVSVGFSYWGAYARGYWKSVPTLQFHYRDVGWEFRDQKEENILKIFSFSIQRPLAELIAEIKKYSQNRVSISQADYERKRASFGFQLKIDLASFIFYFIEAYFLVLGFLAYPLFMQGQWLKALVALAHMWIAISFLQYYRRFFGEQIF